MPEPKMGSKLWIRLAASLIGLLLLVYLVQRASPAKLLEGIAVVGLGLIPVIGLAGLSHVVRTCAWRVTLLNEKHHASFGRMLALRLTSEAAGQIGVFGQVFGEAWRVAGLGGELPVASRITSVALDRALFTLGGAIVTIAGITSVLFLLPLRHKTALYADIFLVGLAGTILVAAIAVQRRWAVLSGPAQVLGRLGFIGRWVNRKRSTILSVEGKLLDFFHHARGAFWGALALNLVAQLAAVLEVYLILRLMGQHKGFVAALAIEGLTKLVSVIGLFNPGNIGTYEGGNMLFAKLVGIGGTAGLTLALIRRIRALFWAAAGAVCLVVLPKSPQSNKGRQDDNAGRAGRGNAVIILTHELAAGSVLARVGELPVLLRAILGAQKAGAARIVVAVDPARAVGFQEELRRTHRLPENVEWYLSVKGEIGQILRDVINHEERIVLIAADRTYHPSLHRCAAEWVESRALALTTAGEPVGLYTLTASRSMECAKDCPPGTQTIEALHEWLISADCVECAPVSSDKWQRVMTSEDRLAAEQKLDEWLIKPTDGVFARMNRKVSIPISRELIKFPITPNMVSLFTLGVSFLAGACFALGGRGNMLLGALLSVFASILDGSDGEVARLTFQESAFGCWLETVCDYLYYVFIFTGMLIGLLGRGPVYRVWGTLLFFGAVASFLTIALQRHRLAGARPEQYLSLWQAQASRRRYNPFLYLGRHTEFLIRRCCLPYLFLAFAVFGVTYVAFIGAAVGANIVWPIALYSYFTLEPVRTPA
jgi:phosphatidylglycerophosphate synthase